MQLQCISRQPIFDRDQAIIGYELRYEMRDNDAIPHHQNQLAHDMFCAFSHIADDHISGGLPAYVMMDESMLLVDDLYEILPMNAVIQVDMGTDMNSAIQDRLIHLRDAGFQVALDDRMDVADPSQYEEVADIIKMSAEHLSSEEMAAHMAQLEMGTGALKMMATQINSAMTYEKVEMLPFDLFQGHFLGKQEPLY